jgi:hypothetical protein
MHLRPAVIGILLIGEAINPPLALIPGGGTAVSESMRMRRSLEEPED